MVDGATAQLILIKLSLFRHGVNEMKKRTRASKRARGREGEKKSERARERERVRESGKRNYRRINSAETGEL